MLIAACCGLAAACGSAPAPSPSSSHPAGANPSASTVTASKVVLDITLAGPDGPTQHWTLRCDPASGVGSDTTAACDRILSSTVFNPPRGHYMCPMIMANARVFTITGLLYGKRVSETVVDGGCDISRYGTLRQIFN
jgi:hypothetical protein